MEELIDKLYDHWTTLIASIISGWLLLKIKAHKDEKDTINGRLKTLEDGHIRIDIKQENFEKNQDILISDMKKVLQALGVNDD